MLMSRADLRRLLLAQQGLLGRPAPGALSAAVTWVRQHHFLPLEVQPHALAPGHDLVLFNRVAGYQLGDLDMALYDDGQLFEHCLHVPGALPARDYTLVHDPERAEVASRPGSVGALVLNLLRGEGPSSLRDLQAMAREHGREERQAVARAVHDLYASGAILIRRREGSQELYDLAERILPSRPATALPVEERLRGLAHHSLRVLAPVTRTTWGQVLNGIGARPRLDLEPMKREKRRLMTNMLAEREAVQVEVRDPSAWYLVPADWLEGQPELPSTVPPRVSFLSPLDPVVWDRQRAHDLFAFDWRREAYPPPGPQRHFSVGALPILYGQALVGRLEPQMSWPSQRLLVHGVYLEDQALLEDPHFRTAFAEAIRELAILHEARGIEATGPIPPRLLP